MREFFFFFLIRIWNEIQNKAKLEILHVFFLTKCVLANEQTAPWIEDITPETFFSSELPSKAILDRWKLILDVFQENSLI